MFAVVTTEANALMAKIHDRMPVILDDNDVGTWLGGDAKDAAKLMKPFNAERSEMFQVSTYVNTARNEGEKCAEPISLDCRRFKLLALAVVMG